MKANILIARRKDAYRIKVEGRATFDCSAPLRNLVHNITPEGVRQVAIDLSACTGMDSTFMGVLAMIALRVHNLGATAEVVGSKENHRHLLDGLGLSRLFVYRDAAVVAADGHDDWEEPAAAEGRREKAETVLDAHETLIAVDPGNREKFAGVVKLVREDLEKDGNNKDKKDGKSDAAGGVG